jgi:hypothetical protein
MKDFKKQKVWQKRSGVGTAHHQGGKQGVPPYRGYRGQAGAWQDKGRSQTELGNEDDSDVNLVTSKS